MELKPGYKQTDVGVFPEDWEIKKLSEISPKQSVGLVINPSTYFDPSGTVPMLVGSNIRENKIDWDRARRITAENNSKLHASRIYADDLVTVRVGDPGVTAVVPAAHDGSNCASVMIIRRHSSFNSEWLCHLMNSTFGRDRIASVEYGTAQKQFNIGDVIHLLYPKPPLPEQSAIATAMSDVDALLAAQDALIEKKLAIKQGAMQELLTGKRRLPGFGGDWEGKRLGEIGFFLKGSGIRKDEARSGSVPCVRYGEIYTHHNYFIRQFQSWISPSVAETATRIVKGDLLFACSGETKEEIGKCVALVDSCEVYAGGDIIVLRTQETDPIFMGYACNQSSIQKQTSSKGQGDAVVHISASALGTIEIELPSFKEQTAIAEVLKDMDAEISLLEQKREKTSLLKQGVMQELLTGKTRLV